MTSTDDTPVPDYLAALNGGLKGIRIGIPHDHFMAMMEPEVGAAIQEKLAESNYGKVMANRGITTVALNEDGEIVEHRPYGTSVALTAKRRPPRRRKANATPTR